MKMFNTYRMKLLMSFVLVLALPILLAGGLGRYWARESAVHEVRLRLAETANGLLADIAQREERLLKMAVHVSEDDRLRALLENGRREEIVSYLTRIFEGGDVNVIEVGDTLGHVLARGHNPPDWGEDKSNQRIISKALDGRAAADIERGMSGIGVRAVAPIRSRLSAGSGVLGTIMVGDSVDSNFLLHYARITGIDIALFEDSRLITTTAPRLDRLPDIPGSGGACRIAEDVYDVSLSPLFRNDGSVFGTIITARNRAEVDRFLSSASRAFWIALASGFVLVVFLAAALVRLFSKPIEDLEKAMRTVEYGRPISPIPETRNDEFGRLESQFNRMAEKLRETSRKVERMRRERIRAAQKSLADRMLAEVAHEIRNPLNAMAAQIELLRTDGALAGPPAVRRIEILSEEIRRLDRTVTGLIAEGGPIRLERSPVCLKSIVEAVLSLLEKEIKRKEIVVMTYFEENLPPMSLDGGRVHQAFLNLILNAIQSMEVCGILSIDLCRRGDRVQLSISDSGIGMTPAQIEEIFDTYYTTKPEGTGLGLSVALRIVEAHEGTIEAESGPGKGTRVSVWLPAGSLSA